MKKIAAFAVAVFLIAAAAVGSTFAYASEAAVETDIYTTGQVDIAFENTALADGFKVLPGATVEKTVKIKNMEASKAAWVWFSVTVPASNETPLVQPSGMQEGWVDLGSASESGSVTYYFGYKEKLASGATTSAGMEKLTFAGQIDRIEGDYYWVSNGTATPLGQGLDRFTIHFAGYAVEDAGDHTDINAVFNALKNAPK